jgi:hypothetical protein
VSVTSKEGALRNHLLIPVIGYPENLWVYELSKKDRTTYSLLSSAETYSLAYCKSDGFVS